MKKLTFYNIFVFLASDRRQTWLCLASDALRRWWVRARLDTTGNWTSSEKLIKLTKQRVLFCDRLLLKTIKLAMCTVASKINYIGATRNSVGRVWKLKKKKEKILKMDKILFLLLCSRLNFVAHTHTHPFRIFILFFV